MTTSSTLAEIATRYPSATRVLHSYRLDFCCGGRQPLAEACADRGLRAEEVLAEIESANTPTGTARQWDVEPLPDLIGFITNAYHRRLRDSLPELIQLANRVEARHRGTPACPVGLAGLLDAIHGSVLEHLDKEERVLFPMILAGEGRHAAGPVHVMELEHDDHARHLDELRAKTCDYTFPDSACPTWRALYLQLQQFERELMEHIHLENNVLFRRALIG